MRKSKLYTQQFHDRVMTLLSSPKQAALTDSQIAEQLSVRGGARKALFSFLDQMVLQGELVKIHRNRYSLGKTADLVTGELRILRSGHGIVQPLDGSPEVFVPQDKLNTALPRDRVVLRLEAGRTRGNKADQRAEGKVIRILERSKRNIVGTLKATRNLHYVVPIDPAYTQNFYVPDTRGARVNDRVIIQFSEWPNSHVNPEAEITEVIGPMTDPSLDTLAIIKHYGLRDTFPPEVSKEAETTAGQLEHPGERRDLRSKFIFTIDPVTARDFDDAISLELNQRGQRVLGIHIADVSHFVKPNSALDREARQRGTSVYLPDKVLPMLPEQLSNGVCSLRPNEDRLTFSVLITFDKNAVPVSREFFKSVICSRMRLTYEQALASLENKTDTIPMPREYNAENASLLKQLHQLAQQMRQRRFAQYALELDIPEYAIIMGANGMIADIRQEVNDISHQLIEECMVAANEAVDQGLSTRGLSLLHRVHEPPDMIKLNMLAVQLAEMGFRPGDLTNRRNLTNFLKSTAGHPLEYDAKLATLKSMKRALYSPKPLGHYGLAKTFYAHFTSPIRRYPDLVVHRILEAALTKGRHPYSRNELAILGISCSGTEQVADEAEKTLIEIKKYRFLEQQLQTRKPVTYDAIVVKVKNFGMFVELAQLQIQGLVHVSSISDQFVRYDKRKETLRAGSKTYAAGTRVKVFVSKVDFDKRNIDFALVVKKISKPARIKRRY